MSLLVAIVVGALFAGGAYLVLQRHVFEVLIGLVLLSQGTNLLIIAAGGWAPRALPPLLVDEPAVVVLADGSTAKVSQVDPARYVDPMPQALILTAIVIGFGLLSFLMVLLARAHDLERCLDFTELAEEPEDEIAEAAEPEAASLLDAGGDPTDDRDDDAAFDAAPRAAAAPPAPPDDAPARPARPGEED